MAPTHHYPHDIKRPSRPFLKTTKVRGGETYEYMTDGLAIEGCGAFGLAYFRLGT